MIVIFKFLKNNWVRCFFTLGTLFLQVIGTLYVPFLVARLIDVGIVSGETSKIVLIGAQMLFFSILASVMGVIGSYLSADLSAKLSYFLRKSLFEKVQTLSLSDMNQFGTSSLLTRTTSDVDNIAFSMVSGLQMILPAPLISLVSIYLTYKISPKLVWIPIMMVFIFLLTGYLLLKISKKYAAIVQEKMDGMMKTIHSFFTGIRVIRAFDNEEIEEDKTITAFEDYAKNMVKLNQIFAMMTPIVTSMLGGTMALILWFGGKLVFLGSMDIGNITASVEYVSLTIMYLIVAAMVVIMLPGAISSLTRINHVLEVQPEIVEDPFIQAVSKREESRGEDGSILQFSNVDFAYNPSSEYVLKNINFSISRGETLGIVGGTGSGKSTIAKLILRFNDPTNGSIRLFNQDIRTMSQQELRERISYVPQKSFLFHGTVVENLVQGKEKATQEEVIHAAKVAQADEFITKLDQQYDSFVAQGGSNFSGGQRQRLCIARALVKEADLFVFDDSFSALDYKTDAVMRAALKEELKQVATIIVAQRLSSIKHADKILVVNEGEIVGFGTHHELMKTNTIYQEFAESQQLTEEGVE